MEAHEKRKYTNILSLYIFLNILFIGLIYLYVLPWYDEMTIKLTETNDLNTYVNHLKNDGPSIDELTKILTDNSIDKNTLNLLSDKDRIWAIIKKDPANPNYIDWLSKELLKESVITEEVENNERIIWNIIPTFFQLNQWKAENTNNASTNVTQTITLDNFIKYIENVILWKHNITSYSSVWINNVNFWSDTTDKKAPKESIWSFTITLDIEGKNSDIMDLIDFIQKSWKLDIDKSWKLVSTWTKWLDSKDDQYSSLNNLLIMIDSLKLSNILTLDDKINKWTITLRFFVKWISYEKLNNIKSKVISRYEEISKKVFSMWKLCDLGWNPICKDVNWSQSVATIKSLINDVNIVKSKIDTKNKSAWLNDDINTSLNDWLSISNSLDSIETALDKPSRIITDFKKWAK